MTSSSSRPTPPANESSEHTANLVYGAPVADVLSADKPSGGRSGGTPEPLARERAAMALALSQRMVEYATNEASIASDNMMALARSRNAAEFMTLYSRFVSEFFNRAARRALNLTDDPGRNLH
jgi:hypothetical protein